MSRYFFVSVVSLGGKGAAGYQHGVLTYVSHREPSLRMIIVSGGLFLKARRAKTPARAWVKGRGTHMERSKKRSTPPIRKKPPPVQKATPISVAIGCPSQPSPKSRVNLAGWSGTGQGGKSYAYFERRRATWKAWLRREISAVGKQVVQRFEATAVKMRCSSARTRPRLLQRGRMESVRAVGAKRRHADGHASTYIRRPLERLQGVFTRRFWLTLLRREDGVETGVLAAQSCKPPTELPEVPD